MIACEECGRALATPASLRKHKAYHHVVQIMPCDKCPDVFPNREILRKHMRLRHAPPVRCADCGTPCANSDALRKHTVYKHTLAPVACDACDRLFLNQESLRRHRYSHMIVRCGVCSLELRRTSLAMHIARAHGVKSADLSCAVCAKTFASSWNLQRHAQQRHGPSPGPSDP